MSQMIFKGKSVMSLPGYQSKKNIGQPLLPARKRAEEGGHLLSFSVNHWMDKPCYRQWMVEIIVPDVKRTCERLKRVYGQQVGNGAPTYLPSDPVTGLSQHSSNLPAIVLRLTVIDSIGMAKHVRKCTRYLDCSPPLTCPLLTPHAEQGWLCWH